MYAIKHVKTQVQTSLGAKCLCKWHPYMQIWSRP